MEKYTIEQIEEEIKQLLEEKFYIGREELIPSVNLFNDLGLDSLDLIELILHIEKKFNIVIDDVTVESVKTLQEAVEATKKDLDKKETTKQNNL